MVLPERQQVKRLGKRTLAMVFFVRFAYSKIQALVMVENGMKIPVLAVFGRLTESTERRERPLGLRNRRQFLY